eukprot:9983934-Karenia_brevis.AAC.1
MLGSTASCDHLQRSHLSVQERWAVAARCASAQSDATIGAYCFRRSASTQPSQHARRGRPSLISRRIF